ncbi:MAG TPA: class I SAM-dependent methyltransferase [Tepidisphaeraceae bacterium]|nr:class I SAM-dependent methyltransferase [Tepidisphaeraceae bacterium]
MRGLRSKAIERGWIGEGEPLLVGRLAFPLEADLPDVVHEFNRPARDAVVAEALEGMAAPQANPSLFGPEPQVVVAEVERYGIPLRTVLGMESGLMRSDPYYDAQYLSHFYRRHYRNLYRPKRFSHSWFLSEQIRSGQRILERVGSKLPRSGRVLDVGCGMGGMLIPFKFDGCEVAGCDYGEEYADRGRSLGLEIRIGGPELFRGEEPFDLIILSHVLEHTSDPVHFLREVAGLLKPTGICYIEVPGLLNLDKWYNGNLLEYLQNAHRWHFTAGTLGAVANRAGLRILECDQTIVCLAQVGSADEMAMANDGADVLGEIRRLEGALAAKGASRN